MRTGILAAAVGIALLISGCGGSTPGGANGSSSAAGSSTTGGSSTTVSSTSYAKELAFTECMRSHGEPNFPDPMSNATFVLGNYGPGMDTPQMQSAERACEDLLPNDGQVSQAQQQQDLMRMLKYSACIRSHGVPNFPEPKSFAAAQSGSGDAQPAGNLNLQSPQAQKAQQACRSLLSIGG